jgi:hypothetical protein
MMQDREHAFVVAASSHMSQVVFDKHVEFCEAYMTALVDDVLPKLWMHGESEKASVWVESLYAVRRRYRLWVTTAMATRLDDFEGALNRMGAQLHFHSVAPGHSAANRTSRVL